MSVTAAGYNNIKYLKTLPRGVKVPQGGFMVLNCTLVINDRGEILDFCVTAGNTDDRNPHAMDSLTKNIFGKLFADKGYISQKLTGNLWEKGIQLVTKQKKNTKKKKILELSDKILLRKRAVIESMIDFLKNICQIEHSRHRICCNFVVNLVSVIAAYSFLPKKPSLQPWKNAIPGKIL